MKVSKNSWHYKLNDELSPTFDWKPVTTCKYIWITFWNILFAILIAFLIGTGVFIVANAVVTPTALLLGYSVGKGLISCAVATWIVAAIFGGVLLMGYALTKIAGILAETEKSVWSQAKEDRKNKVCTLVEFE